MLSNPMSNFGLGQEKIIKTFCSILDEFNVRYCGIKDKVTMALVRFNQLICEINTRWLYIADS